MNADMQVKTAREDNPLTRSDVERLLREAGTFKYLDLSGQNLKGIDLSYLNLKRVNLSGANLDGANLSGTNLNGADLKRVNLSGANLDGADLSEANLYGADLSGINLYGIDLRRANLSEVDWNVIPASRQGTDPGRSIQLEDLYSFYGEDETQKSDLGTTLTLRILEEPLSAQNLTTIITALTELSTKYWLIAKARFADLIEYTQTHNGRFAEEANAIVTKISYNSPMNMDWKVDLSAPSVAEALVITIDGIVQVRKRLVQADLTNQAKIQEIKHAEQQADHEQQMAVLEREQQRLELEQRRLEVLEKQLEVQKKGIEYALEIAGKVVDTLHPGADQATRAMEIQALLPNIIQLQNGKELELALPTLPPNAE